MANLPYMRMSIERERYPKLAAYIERILKRPSFAECIARERAMLERAGK